MAHIDDNEYYKARKSTSLSREKAEEKMDYLISADRIYRIEQGKTPHPDEVCLMANAYNMPELKNYYCNKECAIGKTNGIDAVGEVDKSRLSSIVLDLLSSLNSIPKDRMIDIAKDCEIDDTEIADFVAIRKQLDEISRTIDSLRIWADKHIDKQ